jgi:hypothetical protein
MSYFASPYFVLVSFVDAQVGNICVIGFTRFQFAQSKPPCSLFNFLGFGYKHKFLQSSYFIVHIKVVSIFMNECHPKSNVSHDCVHGYTINLTNVFEESYFHFVVYCVVASRCHEVFSQSMLF